MKDTLEIYKKFVKNLININGISSRREYWMSLLIAFQPVWFSSLLFFLTSKFYDKFLISKVLSIIFLICFLLNSAIYTVGSTTIYFRRMNDIGKKKIFSLILFVLGKIPPIAFFVVFYTLYLLVKPSLNRDLTNLKDI